jgi:hypothetical protein
VSASEINPRIRIGGAAVVLSFSAALAALYLWTVSRATMQLNNTATPQERAVIPWLSPLVLPAFVIVCLRLVVHLWQAYEEKSWPKASYLFITAMLLII